MKFFPKNLNSIRNSKNVIMSEKDKINRGGESNALFLTVESIKELWTKTYNTEGKPDWSHLLPYYDDNIHFRDTIQELHGIDVTLLSRTES